jgi:hypothetical protein
VRLGGEAAALVPADRGAQLVVFYGSEIVGSIDGCGCMGNPRLGGLPYRLAFTEGFRAARPDVGVLQLDAGASMVELANTEGKVVEDYVVEDEWVATALDRLAFDAANLTDRELPYFARLHDTGAWDRAVGEHPMLGRFVSANVEPARAGLAPPPPFVVRTVAAPRLPAGSLRVAVAGVTQGNTRLEAASGYRVTDARAALAAALPRAREQSDLTVVLAYMTAEEGQVLAAGLGGLADVVIVANSLSGDAAPALEAAPRVTYSWYKTQKLGVLELELSGSKVASATNTYVKLDEPLPRDPVAEELAAGAKQAVREAKERRFAEAAGAP